MKPYLFILFLIISFSSFPQEKENSKIINELKAKIATSEKGEKLKWMDSLIPLIEFNEDHQYTNYIQEAVKLALEIDSVSSATNNTADFIYYNNYILGDPKRGLQIFKEFEGKEKNCKNLKAITNFYIYGSDSYFHLKDAEHSLALLQIALEYAEKSKEKGRIATVLARTGFVKLDEGKFAEASQSLQQARKLFMEVKDTLNILGINNSLSILYSQNKFYKEAQDIRDESIEISKKVAGNPQLFVLYYNTAADYREQGNDVKRIEYLKLMKTEFEKTPEYNIFEGLVVSEFVIAYA